MRKDWLKTTLGDSCTFHNGKAHEKKIDENGDFIVVNSKFISSDGTIAKRTNSALFPLRKDDIVMVMSDVPNGRALAKCYLVEEDNKYSLNQRICAIRSKTFDTKFLYYHLNRHPYLLSFNNGENQTNLRRDDILKCPLYIPPLPEQKRIVAILDEAFEGIDRAIANTEKNLANARELFESYLNDIFTKKGDGWVEMALHRVVEPSCSLSYGIVQPGNDYENGLPIVRPTDLTTKTINFSSLKRIDPSLAESYKRTKLCGGELLLCVRGSTGVVGIAGDELQGANVTRGIVPIRFEQSLIKQSFGYYILISKMIQDQIREKTYGTALMQINIRDLKNLLLSVPQPEEQQILVEKLEQIEQETQRLETIYQQKLAALNELKQSILQKAFTGELTADTTHQTMKATEEVVAA